MSWQIATSSHIGGRFEQQDRCTAFSNDDDSHLLVVADGMGGHQGGALASQAVIDSAETLWQAQASSRAAPPGQFIKYLSAYSHEQIEKIALQRRIHPHSTCVFLYLYHNQAWWGHIGDSRLYHFRNHSLKVRTRDHSVVQMLFEMGRIEEHEMAAHPEQGHLLRGLGGKENPLIDLSQTDTRQGDVFILCTDGLWEQFQAQEMLEYLTKKENQPLADRVTRMVEVAVERAGTICDNVSAAVAIRQ